MREGYMTTETAEWMLDTAPCPNGDQRHIWIRHLGTGLAFRVRKDSLECEACHETWSTPVMDTGTLNAGAMVLVVSTHVFLCGSVQ